MKPKKYKTCDKDDVPGDEDAGVNPPKGVEHDVGLHLVV